jgi:hypothetical protein
MQIDLYAQNKYSTKIYSKTIKTLKTYVEGNNLSYPAIELNSDSKILIQFDDLTTYSQNYKYRIIHCNSNWTTSEMFSDEFMDGYNENPIQDFQFSNNTKVAYINYRVTIPNDNVQLKVSGNYIFEVIDDSDEKNTILTTRFVIYEPIVKINTDVKQPSGAKIQKNSQEIDLSIVHEELNIDDPFNEINVIITQNNRPDRVIKDIKPVFVKDNELVYSYSDDIVMQAGNEYRIFSIPNIHKYGLNINDIKYADTIYHIQLRLDERRSFKKYFWEEDMNGKYIINIENNDDDSYMYADYVYVHFLLPMNEPILDGNIYVYGELTNWELNTGNMMTYNFDNNTYEAVLLLKQGYYNYTYVLKNNYTHKIDEAIIEGSHFETENDYIIYVYFKDFSQKFDRLVGYKVVNSKY